MNRETINKRRQLVKLTDFNFLTRLADVAPSEKMDDNYANYIEWLLKYRRYPNMFKALNYIPSVYNKNELNLLIHLSKTYDSVLKDNDGYKTEMITAVDRIISLFETIERFKHFTTAYMEKVEIPHELYIHDLEYF